MKIQNPRYKIQDSSINTLGMNFHGFLFLIFCFFFLLSKICAQVEAIATIDTNKIRIGEQSKIDLYVKYKVSQKINIQWPTIGDTLRKEIEVVNISKIDTTIPDKNKPQEIQQHQTITVTSVDSGFWAIPPFVFVVNNDTAKPVKTEALLLAVYTLPVDTAEKSIRDIKAPFDEPFDWHEYLPFIYWSVAAIILIIIIVFILMKIFKKKSIIIEPPKPKVPAHITALNALEEIKNKKLWQEGKYKEYHTLISDTLRAYIEERYGVAALELTSDEIFKIMNSQVIDTISKEKLKQVLTLADYVKFAKVIPIEVENEMVLNSAFDFVNGTKREDPINQAEENNSVTQ
ncbi:MAG: hypothetical protein ACYDCN_10525 [Bacteroidia bacterium]